MLTRLRSRDWWRRIGRAVVLLAVAPVAVPFLLVARALRPVLLVRTGRVRADRIGHFAIEPELFLARRAAGLDGRTLDLLHLGEPISNDQLAVMWSRVLPLARAGRILDRINRALPGSEPHLVRWEEHDVDGLLTATSLPHLRFTEAELARGAEAMQAFGLGGRQHVCFLARDSAYLAATLDYDWSYHRYRDADVNTYEAALRHLVDEGYAAVRMGAVVSEPLRFAVDGVIDYAHQGRSDFLDVYLLATCAFLLSGASGPTSVATVFRRPIVYVNAMPLLGLAVPLGPPVNLFIPKDHRRDGRSATLAELLDLGAGWFFEADQYAAAGIELVDNTPEEIAAVTAEMAGRLGGTWEPEPEDEVLQQRFWELVARDPRATGESVRVGAAWLRAHRHLLEP